MPFTADEMMTTIVRTLEASNGGTFTAGYRPESPPLPARWEMVLATPTVQYITVGQSFEEAMDRLLTRLGEK
jgi:hypothetical protein